jgi:hypothetical protein
MAEESASQRLARAKALKETGNAEFQKAKLLAKHTAGKNSLQDSCGNYAKALTIALELKEESSLLSEDDQSQLVSLIFSLCRLFLSYSVGNFNCPLIGSEIFF